MDDLTPNISAVRNNKRSDYLNLELEEFIQRRFDKTVEVLRKLPSFEDENFLCRVSGSQDELMVLKLLFQRPNLDEHTFKSQLRSRIDCVHHLKYKGFKCSKFVVGKDGLCVQDYISSTGLNQHLLAVLYSFLPGKELEHSGYVHSKNVIFQIGAFLGCFHAAFKDFNHDSSLIPLEDNAWHLSNYGLLLEDVYMDIVEDKAIRQKLIALLEYAKQSLDMTKGVFRKGVLHGDFQGLNIIVTKPFNVDCHTVKFLPSSQTSGSSHGYDSSSCTVDCDVHSLFHLVSNLKSGLGPLDLEDLLGTFGLIDYEDVSYSYLALEVGRAVADAMVTFLVKSMCEVDSVNSWSIQAKAKVTSNLERESPVFDEDVIDKSHDSIKSEVFKIGGWIICGYLATNDLSVEEYNAVLPAVLVSLCQYYILGLQAMKENPSNSQYIGYCSKEALILLQWLHDMKSYDVYNIWDEAAYELISTLFEENKMLD